MNFNLKITYEEPVQSGKNIYIEAHGVLTLDGYPLLRCKTIGQSVGEGIARAKENAVRNLNVRAVEYMEGLSLAALDFLDEANVQIAAIDWLDLKNRAKNQIKGRRASHLPIVPKVV